MIIDLHGEHDVATVDELAALLARAVALDAEELTIDLSGVDFMSAATVGVIIRAHALLQSHARSLVLRSPSPTARRVIELSDLVHLVESSAEERLGEDGWAQLRGTG